MPAKKDFNARRRGRDDEVVEDEKAVAQVVGRRKDGQPSVKPTGAPEPEEEWEDCSDEQDYDDDDDDVDERFDDMEDDEIVEDSDEVGDSEEDEEDDADGAGASSSSKSKKKSLSSQVRGVTFDVDEDEAKKRVWRSDKTATDGKMELEYSNKAYDSFFQLRTEYPCLSFDIVRDNDGMARTKYPLSMYFVCGSQADESNKNHLYVMKIHNVCKTKHDVESDEDDDDDSIIGDDSESDPEEEVEEVNNGEPLIQHRTINHFGTANRVRCAYSEERAAAVWSDAGHVQVFTLENDFQPLSNFGDWSKDQAANWGNKKRASLLSCSPANTHRVEGYGLGWSRVETSMFASGDCNGHLYVWSPKDGRWTHTGSNTTDSKSIEEIKWSPVQKDVMMVCRAGGNVEGWDTRDMRKPQISWKADPTDINVGDWNPSTQASHLFVTGADSGVVAVWDLRKVRDAQPKPLQELKWHTGSITSVEFSVHNESVLAVTGDDGQCTLWDLSLERDIDEEREVVGELFGREDITGIPDQLMFQHQGLVHPKEVHFHAQIPGLVVTTDFNGLHIFKPMNWKSLMK